VRQVVISAETRQIIENFQLLMTLDRTAWYDCSPSLFAIALRGINTAVRDVNQKANREIRITEDQKAEIQSVAIQELYKTRQTLKNGENMANRLWRIAYNRTRDLTKSSAFNNNRSIQQMEEEAKEAGQEISVEALMKIETPSDDFLRSENHSIINRALDSVGDPCKKILVERYINKTSREAVAKMLNIGVDATDKRIQKCRDTWIKMYERFSEIDPSSKEVFAT
jgi:RNA polymerase sigma factor (sigma-70 family)